MSSKPNDFKLGLFVLGGCALLVAILFVFGASKWFSGKTVEETYVSGNVDGLKTGALVTLRGVPVGQVTGINFTWNVYHRREPRYVRIVFEVDNKVALVQRGARFDKLMEEEVDKGLRARVKSQGIAGATLLALEYLDPAKYPPLRFPWKPRHIYIPSAPGPFSEIIASLNQTIGGIKQVQFKSIGTNLNQDLAAAGRVLTQLDEANLRGLGTNANVMLAQFDGLGTNINNLVRDLRALSGRVEQFVGRPSTSGESLQQIAGRADRVLGQLRSVIARLNGIANNLNTSSLNETLENTRQATTDLEEILHQLKEYPAGMLFGRPPPRARGVEQPKR